MDRYDIAGAVYLGVLFTYVVVGAFWLTRVRGETSAWRMFGLLLPGALLLTLVYATVGVGLEGIFLLVAMVACIVVAAAILGWFFWIERGKRKHVH